MIDGPFGDGLHCVGAPYEHRQGEPAGHCLRVDGHVRHDAEQFLRATQGDAEARDDLVEDQQSTVSRA